MKDEGVASAQIASGLSAISVLGCDAAIVSFVRSCHYVNEIQGYMRTSALGSFLYTSCSFAFVLGYLRCDTGRSGSVLYITLY